MNKKRSIVFTTVLASVLILGLILVSCKMAPEIQTVAIPTASTSGGADASSRNVTLSTTTSGATIYYTIDGSAPTTTSTQYTEAIPIDAAITLKAIAVKAGMNNSAVFTINFYIYSGSTLSLGNGMYIKDVNDNGGVVVEMKGDPKQITNYYTTTQVSQITQKLYTVFADDFDSIIIVMDNGEDYTAEVDNLHGINYRVSNAVGGIGTSQFSNSAAWGSAGKLKSVMAFPYRGGISSGPSLHEFCHNWAAFICPTYTGNPPDFASDLPYDGHWGISNAGGQLGGFKYIRVVEENSGGVTGKTKCQGSMYPPGPDGTFDNPGFGESSNHGNSVPYSDIELYLMGMKSANELRAINFTLDIYVGLSFNDSEIEDGFFYATGKISYTIDQLIALNENGQRVPSAATSQKRFKVLTVFVSAENSPDENYRSVTEDIKWFANMPGYENKYQGLYNFYTATGGVGSLEVTGLMNSLK